MLRVMAIAGESTRFFVESNTLQCTNTECGKSYNRRTRHRLVPGQAHPTDYLRIGDPCPACLGRRAEWDAARYADTFSYETKETVAERMSKEEPTVGTLDVRFHVCDIAAFTNNGQCGCEFFSFVHAPALSRMLPSEQGEGRCRCSHIDAARGFALDVALKAHEHVRYKDARGQREEAQP